MHSLSPHDPAKGARTASVYDASFYSELSEGARSSAEIIVPIVLEHYPVQSVVDVGCGTGDWLHVFIRHEVTDIQGLDGDYVDRSQLQIPAHAFRAADLTKAIDLGRKFSLAVCLEVGEHLPPECAPVLVDSLVSLADIVLFSAAVPGQTGTNHVNEQWPDYWSAYFRSRQYSPVDFIRHSVWNEPKVEWWYAQNIVMYVSDSATHLPIHPCSERTGRLKSPVRLVHPTLFEAHKNRAQSLLEHDWTPGLGWCTKAWALSLRNLIGRHLPWSVFRAK